MSYIMMEIILQPSLQPSLQLSLQRIKMLQICWYICFIYINLNIFQLSYTSIRTYKRFSDCWMLLDTHRGCVQRRLRWGELLAVVYNVDATVCKLPSEALFVALLIIKHWPHQKTFSPISSLGHILTPLVQRWQVL
jgi:hypothetical protein